MQSGLRQSRRNCNHAQPTHCFYCHPGRFTRRATGHTRQTAQGLGGSSENFANTDLSAKFDDLIAAANWRREHHGAPALLVGHSLGAPFAPSYVTHHFGDSLQIIEHEGEAQVTLAVRELTVRRSFLDDLAGQPQVDRIAALGKPLLILHAPDDSTVDMGNVRRIFEPADHPKSFVALDGANHLLGQLAARMIATWAQRYLPVDLQVKSEPACTG